MFRKKDYKDLDKYRKTREAYKKRYYVKTECGRNPWFEWQDVLIMKHEKSDHELSKEVGHSVKAIQVRRARLKRKLFAQG